MEEYDDYETDEGIIDLDAKVRVISVTFYNGTHRSANVYWVSPWGEALQTCLKPGESVEICSQKYHVWRFRVKETGEILHVRNKSKYEARLRVYPYPSEPCDPYPARDILTIHLPNRSLQHLCLWSYAEYVYKQKGAVKIDELNLPNVLKENLKEITDFIKTHNEK